MSIEADLKTLLAPLVTVSGGLPQFYADIIPANASFPAMAWQQVGGEAFQYLEKRLPGYKHGRFQISIWSKYRLVSNQKARLAEKALIESSLVSQAYGAFVAEYNEDLGLYGTRQDFGIFYLDP